MRKRKGRQRRFRPSRFGENNYRRLHEPRIEHGDLEDTESEALPELCALPISALRHESASHTAWFMAAMRVQSWRSRLPTNRTVWCRGFSPSGPPEGGTPNRWHVVPTFMVPMHARERRHFEMPFPQTAVPHSCRRTVRRRTQGTVNGFASSSLWWWRQPRQVHPC